jgi:hypothetical protein
LLTQCISVHIVEKSDSFSIDNNFDKTDEALERFIESITKMVSSTNNIIFLLLMMKDASVSVSNTLISGIVMESCEVHGSCSLSSYESSRFLLRVAIRTVISYLFMYEDELGDDCAHEERSQM